MAERADTIWDRIERGLVGILGALAMIVGLVQVLGRYFFPALAISWAEEVIVYLIVWAVMIVSSQLVRTDGHVRPDLVLRLVPSSGQRWLEAFNCVVALAFSAGMVWYGWEIVDTSLLLDERSSSGLQFPMWIYYSALPAGGALMTMRYLIRLFRYLFRFNPATMTVGHVPSHELPTNLGDLANR
ncbi:TRAP transporter small permease [Rhodopila sp.]|uniref:TRAP transporter small permease n=1 Tax=Rhodopila sp. TaxID=2480087 RepID=UPI003D0DD39E